MINDHAKSFQIRKYHDLLLGGRSKYEIILL